MSVALLALMRRNVIVSDDDDDFFMADFHTTLAPGKCRSLVVARGLMVEVEEEGCYRAPLLLPLTYTSIHPSSKWPLEQGIPLGHFATPSFTGLPYLSLLL